MWHCNNQQQSFFTFSQFTSKFIRNFTWFIIITFGSQLGPCTQKARRDKRQMAGFNKQGDLLRRLRLSNSNMRSPHSPARTVKFSLLPEFSHVFNLVVSAHIVLSSLRPWRWLPPWEWGAEFTFQGGAGGQGASDCWNPGSEHTHGPLSYPLNNLLQQCETILYSALFTSCFNVILYCFMITVKRL